MGEGSYGNLEPGKTLLPGIPHWGVWGKSTGQRRNTLVPRMRTAIRVQTGIDWSRESEDCTNVIAGALDELGSTARVAWPVDCLHRGSRCVYPTHMITKSHQV